MTTNNETKKYVIVFSTLFIISSLLLRGLFETIGWTYTLRLVLLSSFISSCIGLLTTFFLFSDKKRVMGGVFFSIYVTALLSFLILYNENSTVIEIKIGDVWTTKESEGDNFTMFFFHKDSIIFSSSSNDTTVMGYSLNRKEFIMHDEKENFLEKWAIKLEEEKLIFSDGKENLFFYKRKKK